MTTGEKIAFQRKKLGATQIQLAETLGVTRQAVSRWEGDLAFPETDTLIKMSKLFGCSIDYLLNYNEEQPQEKREEEAEPPQEKKARWACRFEPDLLKSYIEFKSKTTVGGLPLVHVNIGAGRTAKGVVAVGLKSVGIVSVGLLSLGVFSVGLLAVGLAAIGVLILGLFAAGSVAVGCLAFGAVAFGLFSMGGAAFGLFACGGYANGYFVAIGDVARGGIAIGLRSASGSVLSVTSADFVAQKETVLQKLEELPAVWSAFAAWCRSIFEALANGVIDIKVKI